MRITADEIAHTARVAIVKTVREYVQRGQYLFYDMVLPEYLITVRVYDALWRKYKTKNSTRSEKNRFYITLEEPTEFVKKASQKPGRTAASVDKNKRHDVCLWLDDSPLCVIEVKRFGNRYGIFDKDLARIDSVVKGRFAPTFSILAFYGYGFYDQNKSQKHMSKIRSQYSDYKVDIQEIRFQGFSERDLAGTITVVNHP